MKIRAILPIVAVCIFGVTSIYYIDRFSKYISVRGNVLFAGQSVDATNKFGSVKVSYVSPIDRRYEWDGRSRTVRMIARPQPFEGRWGLYEGARSLGLDPSEIRLVVQESVIDFENYDQLYTFLYQGSAVEDWVYTRDGLVVGFGRSPERQQINIDLYQILLRGKKPVGLRGARENAIHLSHPEKSGTLEYAPLQGWKSIGGREGIKGIGEAGANEAGANAVAGRPGGG